MSRVKKPKPSPDELWAEYQALQLTPEQKAALRRKVEKKFDGAARDGVYERVIEIAGTVEWNDTWNIGETRMSETKGAASDEDAAWAEYFAAQLTPEEKAVARAEAERAVAEEPGDTYALLLDLVGKVDLDYYDLDELREDRD
jgi:hypothetical protein